MESEAEGEGGGGSDSEAEGWGCKAEARRVESEAHPLLPHSSTPLLCPPPRPLCLTLHPPRLCLTTPSMPHSPLPSTTLSTPPPQLCLTPPLCLTLNPTPPPLQMQDARSCNLSYPLPQDYPLLKQNEKLVEHLITKHGVYVDINKVDVILRVGTGGGGGRE